MAKWLVKKCSDKDEPQRRSMGSSLGSRRQKIRKVAQIELKSKVRQENLVYKAA